MFLTPWVTRLLLANVIVSVLIPLGSDLYYSLAFHPQLVLVRPWTAVTYMFLHGGFGHLLLNMIGLFFFGPRLETRLGGRRFLNLYLLSGLGGAAFSFFFGPGSFVVGASGAVYGILLAFAYYWPRETILIWGVLPVQAWVLATFLVAGSLWSGLSGAGGGVAHFAHLGGLAVGFGYLRWLEFRRRRRIAQANAVPSAPRFTVPGVGDRDRVNRWRAIDAAGLHKLNRNEVEQLLHKLENEGLSSLTQDERSFLDRMAQRNG